jgi:hypothetical protein
MIGDDDLRDCFAMFAMCGYVMQRNYPPHDLTKLSYEVADLMMEARKSSSSNEAGIVAIKRKYERKVNE